MAHECMMYGIVQKDGFGFDRAVEECKTRMARYNVALALYMSVAPEEKITFNIGGPTAVSNFEAGAAGFAARGFRGLGVFTSTPFDVSDDSDAMQMLQRSTQVGEFYYMRSPAVGWPDTAAAKHVGFLDIIIFDEEQDKHQHISFAKACEAAGLVTLDAAGTPTAVNGAFDPKWTDATGGALTAVQAIAANAAGTYCKACMVLARPFIEHLMMSAVMTVSGRDTGATLFGPADMQISANTTVKTIEGHYTCHTKSVITKEQNVLVMRDIMCSGYVAGCNTRFFGAGKAGYGANTGDHFNAIKDAMTERLSFVDDASGEYDSMLAFPAPFTEGNARDQVVSLSNRLLPWEVTLNEADQHKYFPGGQAAHAVYVGNYGLDTVHFGEDIRAAEAQEFISSGVLNNTLCFIGPHRVHSPWSNTFYDLTPGQGHFGPDALPGDARWRRGETVSSEAARNAMVGVEAAAHAQMVYQRR